MIWGKGGGSRWKKVGRKWVFRRGIRGRWGGGIYLGEIRLCMRGKK